MQAFNVKLSLESTENTKGRRRKASLSKVTLPSKKGIFVCQVPECGRTYTTKAHLVRHDRVTHKKEKEPPSSCPMEGCNLTFASTHNVKRHVRRAHEIKCTECGKEFRKHKQRKAHQYEHTGIPQFRCSHKGCDKTFAKPQDLKVHIRRHERYKCPSEDCDAVLDSWTSLRKHRKLKHPLPVECDKCDMKFSCRRSLLGHLKIHEEEREVFACPREGCPRYYLHANNLRQHIYSAHDGRRFECSVDGCNRSFAWKGRLDDHMKLHTNVGLPKKKKRGPRKPRKDKGIPKKLMIKKLIVINKDSFTSSDDAQSRSRQDGSKVERETSLPESSSGEDGKVKEQRHSYCNSLDGKSKPALSSENVALQSCKYKSRSTSESSDGQDVGVKRKHSESFSEVEGEESSSAASFLPVYTFCRKKNKYGKMQDIFEKIADGKLFEINSARKYSKMNSLNSINGESDSTDAESLATKVSTCKVKMKATSVSPTKSGEENESIKSWEFARPKGPGLKSPITKRSDYKSKYTIKCRSANESSSDSDASVKRFLQNPVKRKACGALNFSDDILTNTLEGSKNSSRYERSSDSDSGGLKVKDESSDLIMPIDVGFDNNVPIHIEFSIEKSVSESSGIKEDVVTETCNDKIGGSSEAHFKDETCLTADGVDAPICIKNENMSSTFSKLKQTASSSNEIIKVFVNTDNTIDKKPVLEYIIADSKEVSAVEVAAECRKEVSVSSADIVASAGKECKPQGAAHTRKIADISAIAVNEIFENTPDSFQETPKFPGNTGTNNKEASNLEDTGTCAKKLGFCFEDATANIEESFDDTPGIGAVITEQVSGYTAAFEDAVADVEDSFNETPDLPEGTAANTEEVSNFGDTAACTINTSVPFEGTTTDAEVGFHETPDLPGNTAVYTEEVSILVDAAACRKDVSVRFEDAAATDVQDSFHEAPGLPGNTEEESSLGDTATCKKQVSARFEDNFTDVEDGFPETLHVPGNITTNTEELPSSGETEAGKNEKPVPFKDTAADTEDSFDETRDLSGNTAINTEEVCILGDIAACTKEVSVCFKNASADVETLDNPANKATNIDKFPNPGESAVGTKEGSVCFEDNAANAEDSAQETPDLPRNTEEVSNLGGTATCSKVSADFKDAVADFEDIFCETPDLSKSTITNSKKNSNSQETPACTKELSARFKDVSADVGNTFRETPDHPSNNAANSEEILNPGETTVCIKEVSTIFKDATADVEDSFHETLDLPANASVNIEKKSNPGCIATCNKEVSTRCEDASADVEDSFHERSDFSGNTAVYTEEVSNPGCSKEEVSVCFEDVVNLSVTTKVKILDETSPVRNVCPHNEVVPGSPYIDVETIDETPVFNSTTNDVMTGVDEKNINSSVSVSSFCETEVAYASSHNNNKASISVKEEVKEKARGSSGKELCSETKEVFNVEKNSKSNAEQTSSIEVTCKVETNLLSDTNSNDEDILCANKSLKENFNASLKNKMSGVEDSPSIGIRSETETNFFTERISNDESMRSKSNENLFLKAGSSVEIRSETERNLSPNTVSNTEGLRSKLDVDLPLETISNVREIPSSKEYLNDAVVEDTSRVEIISKRNGNLSSNTEGNRSKSDAAISLETSSNVHETPAMNISLNGEFNVSPEISSSNEKIPLVEIDSEIERNLTTETISKAEDMRSNSDENLSMKTSSNVKETPSANVSLNEKLNTFSEISPSVEESHLFETGSERKGNLSNAESITSKSNNDLSLKASSNVHESPRSNTNSKRLNDFSEVSTSVGENHSVDIGSKVYVFQNHNSKAKEAASVETNLKTEEILMLLSNPCVEQTSSGTVSLNKEENILSTTISSTEESTIKQQNLLTERNSKIEQSLVMDRNCKSAENHESSDNIASITETAVIERRRCKGPNNDNLSAIERKYTEERHFEAAAFDGKNLSKFKVDPAIKDLNHERISPDDNSSNRKSDSFTQRILKRRTKEFSDDSVLDMQNYFEKSGSVSGNSSVTDDSFTRDESVLVFVKRPSKRKLSEPKSTDSTEEGYFENLRSKRRKTLRIRVSLTEK